MLVHFPNWRDHDSPNITSCFEWTKHFKLFFARVLFQVFESVILMLVSKLSDFFKWEIFKFSKCCLQQQQQQQQKQQQQQNSIMNSE
jgi:hypothetical protein